MILGVGVDIVDIGRVEKILALYGERFIGRVFTECESEYACRSVVKRSERFAGRFAVKEAVMKVLGTGKSEGILWKQIETVPGKRGKPELSLHGQARERAVNMGIASLHVSISHDGGKAIAFVIAEDGKE